MTSNNYHSNDFLNDYCSVKDSYDNYLYLVNVIDKMIREKKDISELLKITNERILKENYGLTDEEISLADDIWKKLSKRRLNRGKK